MQETNTYKQDFKYFKLHYAVSMEKMFAAVSDLYAEYWNDFFHFAIFRNEKETWDEAFRYTHEKYLKALKVKNAENILELACGRGGFSDLLASNTKGNVLGIDISRSQLSHTKRYKKPNLKFKQHDIMKIDGLGESFDAVVYMDAACYLPDKELAIKKISKILRPGGRFLLIDWCKQTGLNPVQEELVLYPFMEYWAVPSLETPENYKKYFKKYGLKIIETEDLNGKTRKNWELGYENGLKAVKELSLKDLPKMIWKEMTLGSAGIKLIKEQFPSAIYVKVGFDIGFLRYSYFLGEKI
ncbi:MAG: methyltransferase domain-containing protein [Candidatus Doudnabacteria bacterium]